MWSDWPLVKSALAAKVWSCACLSALAYSWSLAGAIVTRRVPESFASSRRTYATLLSLAAGGTLGLGVWALFADLPTGSGHGGPGGK